jgi:hypothetical protein
MRKILLDILIVGGVVFAYIMMSAFQPGVNDIIATVNASMPAVGFGETKAVINSYPLYSWFIPGLCGLIAIVVNHHD